MNMEYDIQVQFLPNGQMMLYESKSGSSVIMAEENPGFLYMVYCDTGSKNAIEYPLLEEFFLTAKQEFQLARFFGASSSGEKEENKKSYSGCMLGVDWANKLNVEVAIEKNGGQWIDNITQDELYIIVGKDLSDVDVKVIDSLKGKWHKAKIFVL